MSAYSLYCTVCDSHFDRQNWLKHLLREKHQEAARFEVIHDWDAKMRKRVLVLFCDFPVEASANALLQCASPGLSLVSDFVWWKDRPKLALLQFESRKKMKEVVSLLPQCQGSEFWIDSRQVQFVRASDMLELEWRGFLPSSPLELHPSLCGSTQLLTGMTPSNRQLQPANHNYENIDKKFFDQLKQFKTALDGSSSPLVQQLKTILTEVEIPDDEFNKINLLKDKVQAIYASRFPKCHVWMFRRNYLKLRIKEGRYWRPTIFAAYDEHPSKGFTRLPIEEDDLTQYEVAKKIIPQLQNRRIKDIGLGYRDGETNLEFRVVANPLLMCESQLSRLLKYLCCFNPFTYPLLAVIYYWTSVNHTVFSENAVPRSHFCLTTLETASMEWLVIFFFCHKKLIPSPREVLQRPHKQFHVFESASVEIGFSVDSEFIQEWKSSLPSTMKTVQTDNFSEALLKLTLEFFSFCSRLVDNPCILNTLDGEIILRDLLLGSNGEKFQCRLAQQEAFILKEFFGKYENVRKRGIFMMHPLVPSWNLNIWDEAFINKTAPLMGETAKKLEIMIQKRTKNELSPSADDFLQALNLKQPGRITYGYNGRGLTSASQKTLPMKRKRM